MSNEETRELAFYYPNPIWTYGDWIKSLVLFFDGIALLVPEYMKERPEEIDKPIVVGLKEQGLLEVIEPERAVDKIATEKLATAMTEIIASGVLDKLAKEETAFHELSMSRLGWYGDEGLYNMIFEELKERSAAWPRKARTRFLFRCTRRCDHLSSSFSRRSCGPTAVPSTPLLVRRQTWAAWSMHSQSCCP